ncbi:MAG: hypothetical protein CMO81_04555 [Waddliaceae bacterium]|nr:hypothetical protein [Waddliaceae bacterium]
MIQTIRNSTTNVPINNTKQSERKKNSFLSEKKIQDSKESLKPQNTLFSPTSDPKLEKINLYFPRLYKAIRLGGFNSLKGFFQTISTWGYIKQQAYKWYHEFLYNTIYTSRNALEGTEAANLTLELFTNLSETERQSKKEALFAPYDIGDLVVLNFGSITCPIFYRQSEAIRIIEKRYPHVKFAYIYLSEAHPKNWWTKNIKRPPAEFTDNNGAYFQNPQTLEERKTLAGYYLRDIHKNSCQGRVFIDSMDNQALKNYQAWPTRLYVIRMKKKNEEKVPIIVYRGDRGPLGYNPEELSAFLSR